MTGPLSEALRQAATARHQQQIGALLDHPGAAEHRQALASIEAGERLSLDNTPAEAEYLNAQRQMGIDLADALAAANILGALESQDAERIDEVSFTYLGEDTVEDAALAKLRELQGRARQAAVAAHPRLAQQPDVLRALFVIASEKSGGLFKLDAEQLAALNNDAQASALSARFPRLSQDRIQAVRALNNGS